MTNTHFKHTFRLQEPQDRYYTLQRRQLWFHQCFHVPPFITVIVDAEHDPGRRS